jgi:hypothetical protein
MVAVCGPCGPDFVVIFKSFTLQSKVKSTTGNIWFCCAHLMIVASLTGSKRSRVPVNLPLIVLKSTGIFSFLFGFIDLEIIKIEKANFLSCNVPFNKVFKELNNLGKPSLSKDILIGDLFIGVPQYHCVTASLDSLKYLIVKSVPFFFNNFCVILNTGAI